MKNLQLFTTILFLSLFFACNQTELVQNQIDEPSTLANLTKDDLQLLNVSSLDYFSKDLNSNYDEKISQLIDNSNGLNTYLQSINARSSEGSDFIEDFYQIIFNSGKIGYLVNVEPDKYLVAKKYSQNYLFMEIQENLDGTYNIVYTDSMGNYLLSSDEMKNYNGNSGGRVSTEFMDCFNAYHNETCGAGGWWALGCAMAGGACPECILGMYGIFAIGCALE